MLEKSKKFIYFQIQNIRGHLLNLPKKYMILQNQQFLKKHNFFDKYYSDTFSDTFDTFSDTFDTFRFFHHKLVFFNKSTYIYH